MLRWIAYIKSVNPDILHISGQANAMADMLSRARLRDGVTQSEEDEVPEDYFTLENVCRVYVIHEVREEEYEGETLQIERMLQGDKNMDSGRNI